MVRPETRRVFMWSTWCVWGRETCCMVLGLDAYKYIHIHKKKNTTILQSYEALDSKLCKLANKGICMDIPQAKEITAEEQLRSTWVNNLETAKCLSNGVFWIIINHKLFGLYAMNGHKNITLDIFDIIQWQVNEALSSNVVS